MVLGAKNHRDRARRRRRDDSGSALAYRHHPLATGMHPPDGRDHADAISQCLVQTRHLPPLLKNLDTAHGATRRRDADPGAGLHQHQFRHRKAGQSASDRADIATAPGPHQNETDGKGHGPFMTCPEARRQPDLASTLQGSSDIRAAMRPWIVLLPALGLLGCAGGPRLTLPPAPTAAPGSSAVYLYVAEGTSTELDISGGAISVYRVGSDGFLPGGAPLQTIPVTNATDVVMHPVLPVLYVATPSQVLAFDASAGTLQSLCAQDGLPALAPPCATAPRPDSLPRSLIVRQAESGAWLLYSVEAGIPGDTLIPTRLAAFELAPNGGLPAYASSQASYSNSVFFQGAALTDTFAFVSDAGLSKIVRFDVGADGRLGDAAPTPTPIGQPTPTPSPTPSPSPEGQPTPTPSPSPPAFDAGNPGQIEVLPIDPGPQATPGAVLLVNELGKNQITGRPIPPDGALTNERTSRTYQINGQFDAFLLNPTGTRLYAAAYQIGRIDWFGIDAGGNIVDDGGRTFESPVSYPTGLQLVTMETTSGERTTLFVSLGGLARVDAYEVLADGSLGNKPFSSSLARTDSFPTDLVAHVIP